jgi:hypothetical protein
MMDTKSLALSKLEGTHATTSAQISGNTPGPYDVKVVPQDARVHVTENADDYGLVPPSSRAQESGDPPDDDDDGKDDDNGDPRPAHISSPRPIFKPKERESDYPNNFQRREHQEQFPDSNGHSREVQAISTAYKYTCSKFGGDVDENVSDIIRDYDVDCRNLALSQFRKYDLMHYVFRDYAKE